MMAFNSLEFLAFFPIVIGFYFSVAQRWRWVVLLAANFVFYYYSRPVYTILLAFVILVNYSAGLAIANAPTPRAKRSWLIAGTAASLVPLFVFKYTNFSNGTLRAIWTIAGAEYRIDDLHWLLPIGISFYTFQALNYLFDVYRGMKTPERHLGIFAVYVSFFPTVVCGPIERAVHLIPQLRETHHFDYDMVTAGLRRMAWGLFKKLVIADRLAFIVNDVFGHPGDYQGLPTLFGIYLYAFQIYFDFSAYSDIAIGASRILGLRLKENFVRPYLAESVADFWRRWHISLTSWFRDYLYIGMGGNRVPQARWVCNIGTVFLVSGLWHGASWTFVVWGALHGGYYLFGAFTKNMREKWSAAVGLNRVPRLQRAWRILITFHLVLVAWVFFRAPTFHDAIFMLTHLNSPNNLWWHFNIRRYDVIFSVVAITGLMIFEAIQERRGPGALEQAFLRWPSTGRWAAYYALGFAILVFGNFNLAKFIYYQF